MRRITVVRMKKLVAKFKSLCVEYLDCIIITILLLNLKHYYVYYKTIMPASNINEWWNWPVYSGWSILGKVPIYNDYDGSSDVTQFHYPKPHFVKYLPQMNQVSEKLILFEHFPMEDIPNSVDPLLCGGECTIAVGDREKFEEADAVIFSLNFPDVLPERR